jgi:integrase
MMDRLGTPLKVRQERLGHSDPRITQAIYTHVASEDSRRVATQLGRGSLGNFGREWTQKGKRLGSGVSQAVCYQLRMVAGGRFELTTFGL